MGSAILTFRPLSPFCQGFVTSCGWGLDEEVGVMKNKTKHRIVKNYCVIKQKLVAWYLWQLQKPMLFNSLAWNCVNCFDKIWIVADGYVKIKITLHPIYCPHETPLKYSVSYIILSGIIWFWNQNRGSIFPIHLHRVKNGFRSNSIITTAE